MEINEEKLKGILKKQKDDYQEHFDVVIKEQKEEYQKYLGIMVEDFTSQIKLITETISGQ